MYSLSWIFILLAFSCPKTAALNEELTTELSNGVELPLVGMGVGNLAYDRTEHILFEGVHNLGYRLVDTARASRNEHLVRRGITGGPQQLSDQEPVHVVTKVWYTHLGYNRTVLSVQESLRELKSDSIRVHILLHWPRCRDDISWMDCEGEEDSLPAEVKEAGPPPHLDKENAWKESWRALEDMYLSSTEYLEIASIGVSNFGRSDMREMVDEGFRVTPHLFQGNVWTLLFNPDLLDLLDKHKIHFQAYNVMNGILSRSEDAPNAFETLWSVAKSLGGSDGDDSTPFMPSQIVLAWLTQNHVSVIPRTGREEHLEANAPLSISAVPRLSPRQNDQVRNAVEALLRGKDLEQPRATFTASSIVHLFWLNNASGEQVPVKSDLQPGESFHTSTYPGHVFVAYDESKTNRREYRIQANYGDHEQFHIEL